MRWFESTATAMRILSPPLHCASGDESCVVPSDADPEKPKPASPVHPTSAVARGGGDAIDPASMPTDRRDTVPPTCTPFCGSLPSPGLLEKGIVAVQRLDEPTPDVAPTWNTPSRASAGSLLERASFPRSATHVSSTG